MTVKLSITATDKAKNEQKRYNKYLSWGDSFQIGIQEVDEINKVTATEPQYLCSVRNQDDQVIIKVEENINPIFVNEKEILEEKLKNDDVVILTESIVLNFLIHELTGKDLFKGGQSSKNPIVIPVAKKEKQEEKAMDYSNPIGHEIGGYFFEDILEYGNMGVVYKGKQKSLNRPVAIKTISSKPVKGENLQAKSQSNAGSIKRLMNMANLAWRLNHPYIVQIYDTGISREFDLHYVVMEYVEGETLHSILERSKKLEIEVACKVISQLASALSFAHRQSIVHRNVNPHNIIITKNDYVKLVGLALSKIIDANLQQISNTIAGTSMGTIGYISPEQAKSAAEVDFRTDIYSLGVVFYQCLCGKLPFHEEIAKDPSVLQNVESYKKIVRRKPSTPPHRIYTNVPENLSQIVMKCLEPDVDKRYQKAEEVLDDIKGYAETIHLSAAQKRMRAMFPKTPQIEGYEMHVIFEPMEKIGGDFYDFIPMEEGKWGISMGDVTGHGVEAAVIMGMVKSVIKLMSKNLDSASEILEFSNKELSPDMDSTTFTTVACGILDTKNKTFRYARAGHNPLILYNPRRYPPLTTYTPKGTILGVPWALNCEEVQFELMAGDFLIQYTDGITEANSKSGEEFGIERLCETIEQAGAKGAEAMANAIKRSVALFSEGSPESDDVTLLVVYVKDTNA